MVRCVFLISNSAIPCRDRFACRYLRSSRKEIMRGMSRRCAPEAVSRQSSVVSRQSVDAYRSSATLHVMPSKLLQEILTWVITSASPGYQQRHRWLPRHPARQRRMTAALSAPHHLPAPRDQQSGAVLQHRLACERCAICRRAVRCLHPSRQRVRLRCRK